LLKRLDDKPNVVSEVEKVLNCVISNMSIKVLPLFLQICSCELQVETKWKTKWEVLKLLSTYFTRVFNLDRDILSACLPELVNNITPNIHELKQEVADGEDLDEEEEVYAVEWNL